MGLPVGDRLGRFEIVGALGAGGMGEVYRARDPQLQRDVAIKVLPAEFSADAVRRRRFEQEARAAGGLNHPNILAVYDVGVDDARSYMVTELLEGETLAERLARPLPAGKVLDFALQIAAGLAAAHDRGVIHRDIKPGNLFVTTDGRIKILDFGLAKLAGPDISSVTDTVEVDGVHRSPVIGSVTYMSPEQVRGLRIDHRTDIFSLGVVVFEMLAGFPPFRRGTSGDTLNAILHDDPPSIPFDDEELRPLERLARHCLEKSPAERFQNARDLIFDLETVPRGGISARRPSRLRTATLAAAAALALLAAAGIGAFVSSRLTSSPPAGIVHQVRTLTSLVGLEEFPALSPDGRMVAFTVVQGRQRQIFIRYLADSPMRSVTADDTDHEAPRWLPNGESLIYFSPAGPGQVQGAIYRIPALGGAAQRIMASIGGGDVSRGGRLACFRLEQGRIQLVTSSIDGSDLRPVAELQTQHYEYPRWSPDEKWLAFQAGDGFRWDVYVAPAAGGSKPFRITHDLKGVRGLTWLPDSSAVVYASARASSFPYLPPMALWEARLDGGQRQLTSPDASYEQPDLRADGLLSVTRMRIRYDIWKFPFAAVAANIEQGQQITRQTGQVATPSASPDGTEVVHLSDTGGHTNVWVTTAQVSARQLTFEDDPDVAVGLPAWSPDGRWIVYLSSKRNQGLVFGVWLVKPDASDNHQILAKGLSPAWSEDGQWIYYVEASNSSIRRIPVTGGQPEVVRAEPARNVIGVHGSTIYYVVDRALMDGRQQFEIRAAPAGTGPARVIKTIPVERVPLWQIVNPALSPDGTWLAVPLTDGFTTNIWAIATDNGAMTEVTDFGDRPIFIARRVSWSADGRSIFAAIGDGDADVVLLDGLVRGAVR